MAILATAFGLVSRFFGKILTTTLGWASTLLFGRVPASRQVLLAGLTFGSLLWLVVLVGIVLPDIGTFLIALVPGQDLLPDTVIRVLMLLAALVIPAVMGVVTLALTDAPRSPRRVAGAVARGYPLTALLAALLLFLAALAIARKARSLARGWTDAHVPVVVKPGAYDQVASDLDDAVTAAGLEVTPQPAGAAMSMPARWLAAVAGSERGALVPDEMIELRGADLAILVYPMDVLISGRQASVARARAAIASRLTTSHAHMTVSAEAQAVEDRLTALARGEHPGASHVCDASANAELEAIDHVLATAELPFEEWETLYRQRLQVELALRSAPVVEVVPATASNLVSAVVDVVTDPDTVAALDKTVGWRWRMGVAIASIVAAGVGSALRSARRRSGWDAR